MTRRVRCVIISSRVVKGRDSEGPAVRRPLPYPCSRWRGPRVSGAVNHAAVNAQVLEPLRSSAWGFLGWIPRSGATGSSFASCYGLRFKACFVWGKHCYPSIFFFHFHFRDVYFSPPPLSASESVPPHPAPLFAHLPTPSGRRRDVLRTYAFLYRFFVL